MLQSLKFKEQFGTEFNVSYRITFYSHLVEYKQCKINYSACQDFYLKEKIWNCPSKKRKYSFYYREYIPDASVNSVNCEITVQVRNISSWSLFWFQCSLQHVFLCAKLVLSDGTGYFMSVPLFDFAYKCITILIILSAKFNPKCFWETGWNSHLKQV